MKYCETQIVYKTWVLKKNKRHLPGKTLIGWCSGGRGSLYFLYSETPSMIRDVMDIVTILLGSNEAEHSV